jgi:hypothetical protein
MAKLRGEAQDFYARRNFAELLNHVPQKQREEIADQYDYDYRARKIFFEPHLRAWVLFQLTNDETLRDMHAAVNEDPLYQALGAGLDVSIGALSEAHQKRPYEAMMAILQRVLADLNRIPKDKRVLRELSPDVLRTVGDLLSRTVLFDSTTLRLPSRIKAWAEEQSGEELPLKVHLRLNAGYGGIDRVLFCREHEHDHQQYETLLDLNHPPAEHAIYLHDRGYRELAMYDQIVDAGHDFVTAFHSGITVEHVRDLPLPESKTLDNGYTLIRDRIVKLGTGENRAKHSYRLISVKDSQGEVMVIVTSMLDAPVATVCGLYFYRWTIEILFRWLKHVFSLDHLVSHSPNGIMMQVVATLLTYALLILYHQGGPLSLKQLLRELRYQLHATLYQLGYEQGLRDARATDPTRARAGP